MKQTVSLSILDRVDVASPCTVSWDDMKGDERVRHCGQCRLNVYNLSEMTPHEAADLVSQREGRLCVRFYRRADGTMITRDCPVGLRAVRAKAAAAVARLAAAVALILGGGVALGSGRISSRARALQPFATICAWLAPAAPPVPQNRVRMIMGDVCVRPVPPPPTPPTSGGR
jgi:hypothetical protein